MHTNIQNKGHATLSNFPQQPSVRGELRPSQDSREKSVCVSDCLRVLSDVFEKPKVQFFFNVFLKNLRFFFLNLKKLQIFFFFFKP